MRRALLVLATVLMTLAAQAEDRRPIVAVMDVETIGLSLPRQAIERMSVFLTGRIEATGRYQVVPREQLKRRLVEIKKKSFDLDCDQSCRIELGQAVAARKAITTKVVRAGDECAVTLTVLDLEREVSEFAVSLDGKCDENGVVRVLKAAVSGIATGRPVDSEEAAPERTDTVERVPQVPSMTKVGASPRIVRFDPPGAATRQHPAPTDPLPTVQVLDVERIGDRPAGANITQILRSLVEDKIAASGRFRLASREEEHSDLVRAKQDTRREAYQAGLPLDRATSARLVVATRIFQLGDGCVLNLRVADLKSAVVDRAATVWFDCDEASFPDAAEAAVVELVSPRGVESSPVAATLDPRLVSGRTARRSSTTLAAFHSGLLASAGLYRMTPDAILGRRMSAAKVSSFRTTRDAASQIELGVDLAASKAIALEVFELEGRCAAATIVYDLKRFTSDAAETRIGNCDDGSMAQAIESGILGLAGKKLEVDGAVVTEVRGVTVIGHRLPKSQVEALSAFLAARVAAVPGYQVTPGWCREKMVGLVKESYRSYVDQSCQIELGRNVPATKVVMAKITKTGSTCRASVGIRDLVHETLDRTVASEGPCESGSLFDLLDSAVGRLEGPQSP